MKIVLAALLTVSTSVFAHDSSFSSDSCNIDIHGGVRISHSEITFLKNDNHLYKIINNNSLIIEDYEVELTPSQQSLVSQYSMNIRELIPETKSLATDALALASEGVYLAFNELLGEGNSVVQDLSFHFNNIGHQIEQHFAINNVIYVDENGFSGDEFFGETFEQYIEAAVKQTLQNSLGSLMVVFGQELLSSGGDMGAFETRMESFGEKMTHETEIRVKAIKKRADSLCESLIDIDVMEERIKKEIPELLKFNVVTISKKHIS